MSDPFREHLHCPPYTGVRSSAGEYAIQPGLVLSPEDHQAVVSTWAEYKERLARQAHEVALGIAQDTNVEVVQVRIGDAERNTACENLTKHFEAGRISQEEFEGRMDLAMRARTGNDITPLFTDLPALSRPTYADFPEDNSTSEVLVTVGAIFGIMMALMGVAFIIFLAVT